MIADVTHFTVKEGGEWYSWPCPPYIKPSNSELLLLRDPKALRWRSCGVTIKFHALKLSDGAEWDSINGFRGFNGTGKQVPH